MSFLDSFVPQLLATLVGGAIGVFGVWLAFRLQRRAAARDDVDRAVETLLNRIADHVEAVQAYNAEFNMMRWGRDQKLARTFPHAAPVSIAVEVLRMRTSGGEREVADRLAATWRHVANSPASSRGSAAGHMATAITQWRLGEARTTLLGSLDTARQLSLGENKVDTVADAD
ncbi:hypothetical protein CBF90_02080 [Microbacterium sp. AISO3]|uniref:hypothetical protein n=1 Tax=Microbacterium sp. AISO3 TaxID=2002831 RepID=UPI000B4C3D92|nr:hypothetical protein [Microbacterium sp. AISO3]OWP20310.1 hypothetical protein CBF90_17165 [Microbacterium sp. AISO3]OWP23537.1 hypothetical protein CBF90_02080 [Microbacterium sp. AISO3]